MGLVAFVGQDSSPPGRPRRRGRRGARDLGLLAARAGAASASARSRRSPGRPQIVGRERQVPLRSADRASDRPDPRRLRPRGRRAQGSARPLTGSPRARCAGRRLARSGARGDIPVYPYPASEQRDWTLNFSFPGHVSLDLFVQPRQGADVGPIAFTVELQALRRTPLARRLVLPDGDLPEGRGRRPAARPAGPLARERPGHESDRQGARQPGLLPDSVRPDRTRLADPGRDVRARASCGSAEPSGSTRGRRAARCHRCRGRPARGA